jgi:hypothetical protein
MCSSSSSSSSRLITWRSSVPPPAIATFLPFAAARAWSMALVFLQRFVEGDAADADTSALFDALARFSRDPVAPGTTSVRTSDGGADVYGLDSAADGFMVNHAAGEVIWDALFAAADAAGLSILPVGSPACVPRPELIADLPDDLRDDARVISSGRDLLEVIRA